MLTDGKAEFPFDSRENLHQGACVRIQGEMGVAGRIAVTKAEVFTGDGAKAVYDKVKANAASAAGLPDAPSLVKDEVTEKLWPQMKNAALELFIAKKLGRSVLLRFHGDADGISGALALTDLLYCKPFQQNSATYGARDALRDISFIGQESRPLALILDFGSGKNCAEGIGFLRAAGIECLIIDHHPYEGAPNEGAVNPFNVAANASKYTAGYLACEIAAALGLEKEKALGLAKIACSGDKSDILPTGEGDRAKALVLDFLASHMSFGNNLDFYRNVMQNPELFTSIMRQADDTINEAADKAMAKMKKQGEGVEITTFPLEGIAKKDEWPPSGKITTRVFDMLKGEKPLLCIGYTDRSIIMRLNDAAVASGLDANALATKLKISMADFVEGGGGHTKAGAIRVKPDFVKDVLNELVREALATVSKKQQ